MKNGKIIKIAAILILCLIVPAIGAQESSDDIEMSSGLTLQLSSLPEAKLIFTQRFIFPFMQGDSGMTEGNNINLALKAEVTPITVGALVDVVWTPIAFLQLAVGGQVDGGWHINLFGGDLYGLARNTNTGFADEGIFDGCYFKAYAGGTFQFDLAAIIPGDWNHVVFQTYHEINYAAYTAADRGESWTFEADFGENINGFNYYGSIFLGYQMPIILNMVGVLVEMDRNLYDGILTDQADWGGNLIRWHFALVTNWKINDNFSIAVLGQFRTMRNYSDTTADLYYQNREFKLGENKLNFEFYRVAAMVNYRF